LICNIIKEIIRNQAGLDLSDKLFEVFPQSSCQKVVIHRIQSDSFHKFIGIPAFSLPQSENISMTNGRDFLHVWDELLMHVITKHRADAVDDTDGGSNYPKVTVIDDSVEDIVDLVTKKRKYAKKL
jgi:hypothetical protein